MKNYIYLCLLIIATASCKKDFLDRYPQTVISPQLYFKTESDLSLYVNGMLSKRGTSIYVNSDEQSTDDYSTTGNVRMKNMLAGNISADNTPSFWGWSTLRNINYFLDNYSGANTTAEVKNHYAGLARYYRALFYMDKVKVYSNVPWYSHVIEASDSASLYKASDPRSLIIDSIFKDLDYAVNNVRESVPAGTPGLWAVKTMYARLALHEGTYRKYHPELNLQNTANRFLELAKTQANDIITSGKFLLTPNYGDLFVSQDLSANKEVILNTVYDVAKQAGSDINSVVSANFEQSPSRDLVQEYLMIDGSRFTSTDDYQKKQYVEEFKNRDPRIYATFMTPGFVRLPATTPLVPLLSTGFTGYYQKKGYQNSIDPNVRGGADVPELRYAEVLLTYAEASAELGSLTQADIDKSINLLRTRAGIPGLNLANANANPDPVLANKFSDVTGANKGAILEIRRERRVEFAFEGKRYDDLMRWNGGKVFEKYPQGMYFPGLGQYDLTGDNVADIILVSRTATIPPVDQRIKNSLGVTLVYYKVGTFGQSGSIPLENGETGGPIVTGLAPRTFVAPKYYYFPIPISQTTQNPKLQQPHGWE
ncbi:RagB/SusD family nutrient uptake outer membrane protein [Niabella sp. CJ426]|uniref:RagB/SusD family nutrient uptake outer membrane protein n=1 Tax=Niabella sp. CJ426 TaxID=3393740 RepID=UPI003CFBDF5D